ncbi:ankyrin repeat domain-containing protein 2, partial [Haematococcus lacustris]
AVMGNPALQARMQELRKDPEFAGFWSELQTGGMQALMKYYNDPAFLAKLSSKLGDRCRLPGLACCLVLVPAAGPPEVKDLFDAAKYGDTEAVEDFIAIGKVHPSCCRL